MPKVRIIAGQWRGRRLEFPAVPGLRPSGDRLRESVFAWLEPSLAGSRCLDPFAGSGALSFEALSRGAARVTAIERERRAATALSRNAELIGAKHLEVVCGDGLAWMRRCNESFDIVFLDPPFGGALMTASLQVLATRPLLAPGAKVYLEFDATGAQPELPAALECTRQGRFGGVGVMLAALAAPVLQSAAT